MRTTEVTDFHGFFNHLKACEWWNESRTQEYKKAKENLLENDIMINAIHIMLHGESTLTKEMSERHFPRHTVRMHKHLKQIRPMAEEMYHKALKDRKRLAEETAYRKNILHRQTIKYNRMLSLYQRMEAHLFNKWNEAHPEAFDPRLGYSIGAIGDRHHWIISQKVKYEIITEMFGSESGYHARLSCDGFILEV